MKGKEPSNQEFTSPPLTLISPCHHLLELCWGFCACANDECAVGKLFSHCVFGIWTKYLSLGIESGIICSPELRLARDEKSETIEEISTPVRLSSECPGPGHLITGHPQHLSGSPHHFLSFFSQQFSISRGPPPARVLRVLFQILRQCEGCNDAV